LSVSSKKPISTDIAISPIPVRNSMTISPGPLAERPRTGR
jgi:hypothetical protein